MKISTFIVMIVFAVAGLVSTFLLQRRGEAAGRQNENELRVQQDEIERVSGRNRDFANVVAGAERTNGDDVDYTVELAQLRAQAAALQAQQIQLSNQQWSSRVLAGVGMLSVGNSKLLDHNKTIEATMGGGPRASNSKLNDARGWGAALRQYAQQHEWQFPSTLDQAAAYLPPQLTPDSEPWANAPVSGTNDFEIVYQGGTNDLGNIPTRRVALIRERQPWLTPDGKWARTYGFIDGGAEIVTSDDDFQSWDTVYVVPPPVNP